MLYIDVFVFAIDMLIPLRIMTSGVVYFYLGFDFESGGIGF